MKTIDVVLWVSVQNRAKADPLWQERVMATPEIAVIRRRGAMMQVRAPKEVLDSLVGSVEGLHMEPVTTFRAVRLLEE